MFYTCLAFFPFSATKTIESTGMREGARRPSLIRARFHDILRKKFFLKKLNFTGKEAYGLDLLERLLGRLSVATDVLPARNFMAAVLL